MPGWVAVTHRACTGSEKWGQVDNRGTKATCELGLNCSKVKTLLQRGREHRRVDQKHGCWSRHRSSCNCHSPHTQYALPHFTVLHYMVFAVESCCYFAVLWKQRNAPVLRIQGDNKQSKVANRRLIYCQLTPALVSFELLKSAAMSSLWNKCILMAETSQMSTRITKKRLPAVFVIALSQRCLTWSDECVRCTGTGGETPDC